VTWDVDGRRYGRGAGLAIEIDGREVARRATLGRLTLPIARRAQPAIVRGANQAVQLVRGQFPKPSASSNPNPEKLQDAVDGRVWFYPELPNGWDSAGAGQPEWFAIDFGRPVSLAEAELAFFADGRRFAAPRGVEIEVWRERQWQSVAKPTRAPLANGVTRIDWPAVSTERIRLRMTPERGRAIRLVEFKAFSRTR
jgi:hypothetical protein